MNSTLSLLTRRWWLVPVLVIVTGGSGAVNFGERGDFHTGSELAGGIAAVVLAVLSAAVLFAVDRWPLAVVANGALVGGYFAIGGHNGPIFFTIVVAAFLVATRRSFRAWWPLLLVSAVLVWAGLLTRGLRWDELTVGVWQAMGVGALVSAAAAIATTVRAKSEALAIDRRRAATEEQLRMAQDLHDGVGHGLAVIAMQAGVALHVLEKDPAAVREALEAIRDTSRESLDALRSELSQMTGEVAQRAPRRGLADLPVLIERVRAAGPEVRVDGNAGDLPPDVDAGVYAIVQESLTNVLRHADAAHVVVALDRRGDTLTLSVVDDGIGGVVHDEGMGLRGMRERVGALGGTFESGPAADGGFAVRSSLPLVR
ncbi:sensor histidine kinase [Nocardioides jensenii]|uniref:sensor histidine kinase n=1 Tax=Nocardioides jensenii TaxID=1843 RepID=UPI00083314BC|nr:sensor histidine kinase [Nocardioides jensenii]